MSARIVVTGTIAKPGLRWTAQQRPVLDLRICATARSRSKTTGEWDDVGAPLWLNAAFWDDEAQSLADHLSQGDRVSVEGTLVVETYKRRDGGEGTRMEIRSPRFLGVIPRRKRDESGRQTGGQFGDQTLPTPEVAPF